MSFSRPVSGLLHQFDGTLAGWTAPAEWSVSDDPGYSCFNPLKNSILGFDGNRKDYLGCREAHPFKENGVDYLIYDACSLERIGWVHYIAFSKDGWLTQSRIGPLAFGLENPAGGTFSGTFTEWFMKIGDTYYIMAAATHGSSTAFGVNNYPLASGGAYAYVVWAATNIFGPYTGAVVPNPGVDWAITNFATNCILLIAGLLYNYCAGDVVNVEGLSKSASLYGPWVLDGAADQVFPAVLSFLGSPPRANEGFSVFLSPTHGIYIGLTNSFQNDGSIVGDDANIALWGTADPTVWPNVRGTRLQSLTPMEGADVAINEAVPVYGPDSTLVYDADTGIIPVTFATCATPTLDGAQLSPQIRYRVKIAMLEPTIHGMLVTGEAVAGPKIAQYPLAHSDLSLELTFESSLDNGSPAFGILFRSDATRQNCYSAFLTGATATLYKTVGGVRSTLQTNGGHTQAITSGLSRPYRIQLVCSGDRIQLYLDGELQIDYTDVSSPIASGTDIALSSERFNGEVRCMSARTGNTITVTGMNPGTSVIVKGYCGYVAGEAYADETGTATFENPHYPLATISIQGFDYTPAGGIWGGDEFAVSGLPAVVSSLEAVIGL